MTSYDFPSYIQIIESRFQQRKALNPSYSLRAYSRDLNISVSQLSELRSGKYGVSPKKAQLIADKLGLNTDEKYRFLLDVNAKHSRNVKVRIKSQYLIKEYLNSRSQAITESHLNEISDWHHFAVLEFTRNNTIGTDINTISQRLNLPPQLVQSCIDRLLKVGLLSKSQTGQLKPSKRVIKAGFSLPSRAVRNLHTSLMSKATHEIHNQDIDKRYFGSVVFPLNKKQIPEAIQFINQFKMDFFKKFQTQSKTSQVYALGVQLFSLEQKELEKS